MHGDCGMTGSCHWRPLATRRIDSRLAKLQRGCRLEASWLAQPPPRRTSRRCSLQRRTRAARTPARRRQDCSSQPWRQRTRMPRWHPPVVAPLAPPAPATRRAPSRARQLPGRRISRRSSPLPSPVSGPGSAPGTPRASRAAHSNPDPRHTRSERGTHTVSSRTLSRPCRSPDAKQVPPAWWAAA